ncbi:MAG: hypothetical protein ACM3VZ_10980 [Acidobacteriota bacterium]
MGARLLNEPLVASEWVSATPWGKVRLSVPWGDTADAKALIQQLEHWCQRSLCFVPGASGPFAPRDAAPTLKGTVADARLAPLGSEVTVPVPLLDARQPPLALQGAAMDWQRLKFEVTVSSLDEASVDDAAIRDHGMVLLPEAFQTRWLVRLQTPDAAHTLWGHLQLNAGVIDLLDSVEASELSLREAQLASGAWQVRLSRPVVLDLPLARGWAKGTRTVALDFCCDQRDRSGYGLSAQLTRPDPAVHLSAMVVPVMLGAALHVQAA